MKFFKNIRNISLFVVVFTIVCPAVAENYPYRSDINWVTTPSHDNWLYTVNEEASVTVNLYHYGIRQNHLEIEYEIGPELLPADTQGAVTLVNGQARITVGTMLEPGFRDLRLTAKIDGETYKHHIKLGFSPEKLTPYTQMPDDFTQFWQTQLKAASKVPVSIEKTFVAEFSDDQVDCYLVKIQAYQKGQYVYGYLTVPKQKGKYPVVISPPGAGIKPMTPEKHLFYAQNGVIRFDMEIHGIRPNLDKATYNEISAAFGKNNNSYLVNGLDDPDNYYLKKAYLSMPRVVDFLTSLTEWDGKNVIAQGGSQGGALALVLAGLDKRITAVSANHPALSDMAGYKAGRAGGYPHLFNKFSGMDTTDKLKTLQYYDVVNFARQIKVPVFMTWGYNDDVCPPTTSYIVYNTITSEKTALITPVNEHWVSTKTRHKILDWIKAGLK
ncbi:acetylxylan esterase [Catenovulum sp. 2E275]|uniref:acetylxylan esterase n=1 Tax=Catenovulum sp. 2E275 TaxID=2980497 RepID=UPI0021D35422|nr:acetylxylan esterase [Catenovulum sp. 2E275]MCU4677104.1 acetylxylan esterase [Catenovulum sp. 2E275]